MATANVNQGEWYTTVCDANHFTLPVRYQEPTASGHGAFGAVIRATDTQTGTYVAIKKMLVPFQSSEHAKRTYRELKLLIELNHPDIHIVQLLNVFTPEHNLHDFQTLYLVLNYADFNLNQVIQRNRPFSEDHIRQIMYSLLRGLKYMHSAGVIHRDLKPTNIGIDKESNVTILDFGLARVLSKDENEDPTTYVSTRWWRAPEIYLTAKKYREQLDIWSIGSIMAELIRLQPVFRGTDHIDQLNKIFDLIGTPDPTTLSAICTPAICNYLGSLPFKPKQDFNALFGYKYGQGSNTPISGVSEEGVKFLDRLLTFDYRQRPTAEEALADPFLSSLHDPMEEPKKDEPVKDEHEYGKYNVSKWKSIVWQMVQDFVPPPWVNSSDDNSTDEDADNAEQN